MTAVVKRVPRRLHKAQSDTATASDFQLTEHLHMRAVLTHTGSVNLAFHGPERTVKGVTGRQFLDSATISEAYDSALYVPAFAGLYLIRLDPVFGAELLHLKYGARLRLRYWTGDEWKRAIPQGDGTLFFVDNGPSPFHFYALPAGQAASLGVDVLNT